MKLPDGWKLEAIKNCCTVVSGSTPKRNKPEYWDNGNIPWVTPKDLSKLHSLILQDTPEKITQLGYDSCSTTLLPKGSILFSSRAPIGHVAIAGRDMCTNQGFKSLIPNDSVDSNYLYWCMRQYAKNIESLGSGSTFKEVSKGIVGKFKIPLPPIALQRRIASILDKADEIRRKRQEAIKLTEELGRSLFLDMFGDPVTNPKGWEITKLKDVLSIVSGQVDPKSEPYIDMPHVGGENMESNTNRLIKIQTPRELGLKSGKYLFRPDDVLYSKIRPYLNKVVIPHFEGICSADIYPLRVKENEIEQNFLAYLLRLQFFLDYAEKHSTRTNIPKINRPTLLSFTFPCPPIETQKKFSDRCNKVSEVQNNFKQSVTESENLFNSLLQRAFKGEL